MGTACSLPAQWRAKASDMERAAKAYSRSCIEAKAAQLILGASLLRSCARELEEHEEALAKAREA